MNRKLRMGMLGGGEGAFIGAIHRFAAQADGQIELVCGAFSSDPAKSLQSGRKLHLMDNRIYPSYREMIVQESKLPEDERMDFLSIVTPNHMHFEPAMLALDKGFHVLIEKPITLSLHEAEQLQAKLEETGLLLALAHTYTGYPMVKEAKSIIGNGVLGKIRKVFVNYHQGWLSTLLEEEGNKQAAWRTDPGKSGICGAMGDIGVHAFNLAEYISGLKVSHISAQLNTVVDGRRLDDDGMVMLKFGNGASGILTACQVAAGEENNLSIKIYGEKGGLEWHQMEPNTLLLKFADKPMQVLRAGQTYLSPAATQNSRTPAGHPEGYLEAFGNIYLNFAAVISSRLNHADQKISKPEFEGIDAGLRGMLFIEKVVESHYSELKWIRL
ncbi:Gfo/Idh/MocA family protein [Peijinzhouia sedimentorum]